jgi:hypothetical protein
MAKGVDGGMLGVCGGEGGGGRMYGDAMIMEGPEGREEDFWAGGASLGAAGVDVCGGAEGVVDKVVSGGVCW